MKQASAKERLHEAEPLQEELDRESRDYQQQAEEYEVARADDADQSA
eukprot:CAMPEP_0168327060 /NCGR_PEP_ID=MMETSP0213-20121227/5678_1 /TAXON_ID=151035 /ORGANISM="Euplotes harpa, Strain FSP1.4" /LENGTH=46 /DNA_ID= /DNA_START= /DNA_END= /DNA_ORIENTATION=